MTKLVTALKKIGLYKPCKYVYLNVYLSLRGQANKTLKHGNTYHCNICNSNLSKMYPFGINDDFFVQNTVIGGGYRDHVICPVCNSADRERMVYYFLEKHTSIFSDKCKVLHFAPERNIEKKLKKCNNCDYMTGDIVPGRADCVVDITNIQFADGTFDYIICNHVMEHITNEELAFSELKRVLKPAGKLILSVPVCISNPETSEDLTITSSELRLKHFGQEDHVRLYGLDTKIRLEKYGLKIDEYIFDEREGVELCEKYGLIKGDRLYYCGKNV